jgi:hypothetical protein
LATRYSTLVVWLRSMERAPGGMRDAFALIDGTNGFPGHASQINSNTFRLQFSAFARERDRVPLRVRYGTDVAEFFVRQPRGPVRVANDTPVRELPQTNDLLHTQVIFRRLHTYKGRHGVEFSPSFAAVGTPRPGWIQWRFTVLGQNGNWADGRSPDARYMGALVSNHRLRFVAEGTEYISAAFVKLPPPTEFHDLAVPERGVVFGLRGVVLLGAGLYDLSNGVPIMASSRRTLAPQILHRPAVTGEWRVTVQAPSPSLLYWSDLGAGTAPPKLRLRERLSNGGGRVFAASPLNTLWMTNTAAKAVRVAALFTPALPPVTTNLEVEVVAALPPAAFDVAVP